METNSTRPPIVTILGHVDHGKTTLLDTLRKTNVQSKEAGGITQSIGASQITTPDGKKITFIDTPGHAAFEQMRSRGAKVADIAVLVVGADDGVKPQTIEALEHIRSANIPFIVAITKMDLPSASLEIAQSQLEQQGVSFEGRGGNVPIIGVSARKGEGVQDLVELITLVAEVNNIQASPEAALNAVVIETKKDKRGNVASVVIRNGQIKTGQTIFIQEKSIKVRGIFDQLGNSVKQALPADPVEIIGFDSLPEVGTVITDTAGSKLETNPITKKVMEEGKLPVILKAQNTGSLEALVASMPAGVYVIEASVGDVNENDLLLAKATNAKIFVFEAKVSSQIAKLAETDGVYLNRFDIIYKLLEEIDLILKSGQQQVLGKAEILAVFPYEGKRVAGAKVTEGKITKSDKIFIARGETQLGQVKVISLKRGKQEILEAKPGEEFGLLFEPQLDFAIGDMIVSVA